jgi:hypothetical protein
MKSTTNISDIQGQNPMNQKQAAGSSKTFLFLNMVLYPEDNVVKVY